MKTKLAILLLATAASAHAVVIYDSNFDSLATGALANNAAIATGLAAGVAANATVDVVDLGGGNNALTFTDNTTSFLNNGSPLVYSPNTNFSTVTTGATGNNMLNGSFELIRLGTVVPFQFYIQNVNQIGSSTSAAAIRIEIAPTGAVSYIGTTATVSTGFTMMQDTSYTFQYNIDLSSLTQDIFGFSIAATSAPLTSLFSVSNVGTRSPNGTPSIAVFRGGSSDTAQSAFAAYQLDNASLNAVPEPTSAALLGLSALGLLAWSRKRRA